MQQINKKYPNDYLLAMRVLWAPVALMIVCWVFIPESPWFYARHGNKEKAIKSLKQLYGGVENYDYEEEYGIIVRTIAHERELLQEAPSYRHVFKGLNLVSERFYSPYSVSKQMNQRLIHTRQKRAFIVVILTVSQQFAGLAIINTYSTCEFTYQIFPYFFVSNWLLTMTLDFFSLAGLKDPFLGTVILR